VETARRKVASAMIETKMLVLKGGNVAMIEKRVFECMDCGHRFECPYGTGRPQECPSCRSGNVCRATEDRGGGARCRRGRRAGSAAGSGGRGGRGRRGRGGASALSGPAGRAGGQTEGAS
jgi:hypothetical protein